MAINIGSSHYARAGSQSFCLNYLTSEYLATANFAFPSSFNDIHFIEGVSIAAIFKNY